MIWNDMCFQWTTSEKSSSEQEDKHGKLSAYEDQGFAEQMSWWLYSLARAQ